MERLTKHVKNERDDYACIQECEKGRVHGWLKSEAGCRCEKFGELLVSLCQIEDILGDTYNTDRLRELVEADKQGRALIVTDEMATAMRAGAYVLRDDDLAGAGLNWRPKSKKGETLYISYYKAADMLKEAAEAALAKEADHE